MTWPRRVALAAALPILGWAAVSFPQPFAVAPGLALLALAVTGFVVAARTVPPWSMLGGAMCVLWVALVVSWWAPEWVPSAVASTIFGVACMLWLTPFVWTIPWRGDPDDEDEPEPQRRQIVVRDAGEAGVDVGGIDTAFDYPLEDFTPRTPPAGWVPRSMVTGGAPIVGVFEDDEAPRTEDGPLPERLLAVWPAKPNGDPYASLHAADLAPLVSLTEPELVAELEAAGVCEKVTARPLAVDPVTGKRPTQTGRKGLRHSALHDWAGATARAMP